MTDWKMNWKPAEKQEKVFVEMEVKVWLGAGEPMHTDFISNARVGSWMMFTRGVIGLDFGISS